MCELLLRAARCELRCCAAYLHGAGKRRCNARCRGRENALQPARADLQADQRARGVADAAVDAAVLRTFWWIEARGDANAAVALTLHCRGRDAADLLANQSARRGRCCC